MARRVILAVPMLLVLGGCALRQIHLHREVDAQNSQKALEAWSKVQAEPALKTALENIRKIEKAEMELSQAQSRSTLNFAIRNAIAGRWKARPPDSARDDAKRETNLYGEAQAILNKSIQDFLENQTAKDSYSRQLERAKTDLKAARGALSDAETKLKEAQEQVDADKARMEGLSSGIGGAVKNAKGALQKAVDNLGKAADPVRAGEQEVIESIRASSTKEPALKAAAEAVAQAHGGDAATLRAARENLDKLLGANQEDALKKAREEWEWVRNVAPAGILKKEFSSLQEVAKAGKEIVDSVSKIEAVLPGLSREGQPGLRLVRLGYALDIARAAKDRLDEEIRHLSAQIVNGQFAVQLAQQRISESRRIAVLVDGSTAPTEEFARSVVKEWLERNSRTKPVTEKQMDAAMGLLGVNWKDGKDTAAFGNESVLSSLEATAQCAANERRAGNARPTACENKLTNMGLALIEYVALRGYEDLYRRNTERTKAAEDHAYARRLDAINAAEREHLIQRGLQALAAFHKGGITEADAARIVQAGEVLSIAIQGR